MADAKPIAREKAATRQSGVASIHGGAPVAARRLRSTTAPSRRPAAEPNTARSRLSVNNWRISLPLPAPMATRMAISRRRATPRANSMLPKLPQATARIIKVRVAVNANTG